MSEDSTNNAEPNKNNLKKYLLIAAGAFALIFVIAMLNSKPSAETVFNNALSNMLQVESVTIEQDLTGSDGEVNSIDLNNTSYLEMTDEENYKLKGTFSIDIVNEGVPIKAEAEFIVINDDKYIKFKSISAGNSELASAFAQVEEFIEDKWIKVRDSDDIASLVDLPVDAVTSVTALPYANLSKDNRDIVLALLTEEGSFTINESSEVKLADGVKAYRYDLDYDTDTQDEVEEKLNKIVAYFSSDSEDSENEDELEIKELVVWVDIKNQKLVKMEYSGTSSEGDIEGTINFSKYSESEDVSAPNDINFETELLQ